MVEGLGFGGRVCEASGNSAGGLPHNKNRYTCTLWVGTHPYLDYDCIRFESIRELDSARRVKGCGVGVGV